MRNHHMLSDTTGLLLALALVLAGTAVETVQADTITMTTTWDVTLRPSTGTVISNTAGAKPIGWNGSADTNYNRYNWFIPVDLSSLAPGETVSAVTLSVKLDTINLSIGDPSQFAADLYGIGYSASILTLPDVDDNLFYRGADDPNHTKLMDAMIAQGAPKGNWYTASTSALEDYLNNRPVGDDVVWLRMNQDTIVTTTQEKWNMGYLSDEAPTLEYSVEHPGEDTAIPEPATLGLLSLSVCGLLARRRRRRG